MYRHRGCAGSSVEIVFPVVVQALERERGSGGSAPAGAQSIAAMLADVVEAAHAAVGLAHDDDGLRADLGDDVVARMRDIQGAARDQPDLGPKAFPFEAHKRRRGVPARVDDRRSEVGVVRLFVRCPGVEAVRPSAPGLTRTTAHTGRGRAAQELFIVCHSIRLARQPAGPADPRRRISWYTGSFQLPRSTAGYSAIRGRMSHLPRQWPSVQYSTSPPGAHAGRAQLAIRAAVRKPGFRRAAGQCFAVKPGASPLKRVCSNA